MVGVCVDLERPAQVAALARGPKVAATQREAILIERHAGRVVDLVLGDLIVDHPVDLHVTRQLQ